MTLKFASATAHFFLIFQRQIDVLFVLHALEECAAFFALNKLLQRDFNRDAMSLAGEVLG